MVGLRITSTDPKEGAAQLAPLRVYPYAKRAAPAEDAFRLAQGQALEWCAAA